MSIYAASPRRYHPLTVVMSDGGVCVWCSAWCGVRAACGVRAVAQTERRARAAGRREAQGQGRYSTALERRALTPPSHAMVTERSTSPAASSPVSNAPCTHCAASTLHAWLRVG